MAIAINGNGTLTGVSVGGLPDGIVDTDMLAAGAVTAAKRGAGAILQVVNVLKTGSANTTDTNISSHPYGAAVSGFEASITPSSTSNKVLVRATFGLINSNNNTYAYSFLYKGNTLLGAATATGEAGAGMQEVITIERLDSPNTTSSTTYSIRLAAEASIAKIGRQGQDASSDSDRMSDCSITLMEVAA